MQHKYSEKMSKSEVKKYIKELDRTALEELVLDLYSARKEAQEFLDYAIKPNDNLKLQTYKAIVEREFLPNRGIGKMRFSECRKAVRDFKALDPIPELLADLMLYIPECAMQASMMWGDMEERFYDAIANNFKAAMKQIQQSGIQPQMQERIDKIIMESQHFGYGLGYMIENIYFEYRTI